MYLIVLIISRYIDLINRHIELISWQYNFFFTVPNCRDNKSIYQDNYVGYIKINISWGGPNTLPYKIVFCVKKTILIRVNN